MPRPQYNLRSRQAKSGFYRETPSEEEEEEDQDEEFEEERGSPSQGGRSSSRRADSDDSHMNSRDYDSSILSSTTSDSFTYHSGSSPSASSGAGKYTKLYPSIPPSGSPLSRRRNTQGGRSPRSSPDVSSQRLLRDRRRSFDSSSSQKKDEEILYSFCGVSLPAWQWVCVLLILVLLGSLIFNRLSSSDQGPNLKSNPVGFPVFSQKVDELKVRFPGQSERFWKTIKASTKHVLESDQQSTYPAILLMVAEKRNTALAARVAQAVAEAFESSFSGQTVSSMSASLNLTTHPGKVKSDSQKLELDNWLKKNLDRSHNAVIVNHLETLEPNAALLLHGYCDGDNAPYKNAMLIFGLFVETEVKDSKAAEAVLRNLWISDLSEDKVGALLSRVANNIALLSDSPNQA